MMFSKVSAAVIGIGWTFPAFADPGFEGGEGHMHWMGDGWSHGIFGPAMMIIALAIVGFLILAVARGLGTAGAPDRAGTKPDENKSAIELLKERFARGDIDAEEFTARKKILDQ